MPSLADHPPRSDASRLRDAAPPDGTFRRELAVRADGIDEANRSFEAVATTEERVRVVDWSAYELIEEVLLADGVRFAEHVPLFEDHRSYTSKANVGHVLGSRRDGSRWLCRAAISEPAGEHDPAAQHWVRVRDRHQRSVSVGYQPVAYTDIPPGKKATVAGREYEAGALRLRVAQETLVNELSLVGLGADPAALVRSLATLRGETNPEHAPPRRRRTHPNASRSANPTLPRRKRTV